MLVHMHYNSSRQFLELRALWTAKWSVRQISFKLFPSSKSNCMKKSILQWSSNVLRTRDLKSGTFEEANLLRLLSKRKVTSYCLNFFCFINFDLRWVAKIKANWLPSSVLFSTLTVKAERRRYIPFNTVWVFSTLLLRFYLILPTIRISDLFWKMLFDD